MDIEKLDCWGSLLRAIPITALVMLTAQFLGRNFLSWVRSSADSSNRGWADFHLASVLGLNLLGLSALVVSLLPLSLRYTLLGILCLAAGVDAARRFHLSRKPITASWNSLSWSQMLIGLAIAFTLGPALAYPSGWDELTYHIELPRRWFNTGAFTVQFDLPYSALPSLLEAVFTLTYPVEALITPRLLVWIVWLHGMFVFLDACSQVASRHTANCLTFALAASPIALLVSANCYVESLIWANMACLLRIMLTRSSSEYIGRGQAVLLGLFIGGAIAIKMTSVGLMCLPILLAICRIHNAKFNTTGALTAMLTASGFAAPFYLRTWLWTGNPVMPFYAQWFTTDSSVIECSRYHHDLAVGNFGMHSLPGFIIGPGALAFASELYDGSLGWQWLVILCCFTVAFARSLKPDWSHRSLVRFCLSVALLLYALWFFTAQQARFVLPLVMIVTLAAGCGIESYQASAQRWWRVALVSLALVSLPWNNFGYYLDSWLCVLKVRTPLDYIRDGVSDSYAELAIYMHEHMPADAKMVSLFEHRLAYLPPGVEIATPYFQTQHFRSPASQSAQSLMAELRDKQIQYVILTTSPLGPDVSPARIEAQQIWFRCVDQCIDSGQLKIVWKSEFHGLAQVTPP